MFRVGLGFVHTPWNAGCLGFSDRTAQPLQFLASQETFAAIFFELFYPARRVGAFWHYAGTARERVHAADHRQHSISLKGRVGERGMQPADWSRVSLSAFVVPTAGFTIRSRMSR